MVVLYFEIHIFEYINVASQYFNYRIDRFNIFSDSSYFIIRAYLSYRLSE